MATRAGLTTQEKRRMRHRARAAWKETGSLGAESSGGVVGTNSLGIEKKEEIFNEIAKAD